MDAIVYCDGSGLASRGPGGLGYSGYLDGRYVEGSRGVPTATNQQAELLAAAFALDELPVCGYVRLISDSEYVVKGMNEWMPRWVSSGKLERGGVANTDHWARLQTAVARHGRVRFSWTRGHSGTPGNERADELAGAARRAAEETAAGTGPPDGLGDPFDGIETIAVSVG